MKSSNIRVLERLLHKTVGGGASDGKVGGHVGGGEVRWLVGDGLVQSALCLLGRETFLRVEY